LRMSAWASSSGGWADRLEANAKEAASVKSRMKRSESMRLNSR
jgi:hypothetical protein